MLDRRTLRLTRVRRHRGGESGYGTGFATAQYRTEEHARSGVFGHDVRGRVTWRALPGRYVAFPDLLFAFQRFVYAVTGDGRMNASDRRTGVETGAGAPAELLGRNPYGTLRLSFSDEVGETEVSPSG